jgi:hypothetical protein
MAKKQKKYSKEVEQLLKQLVDHFHKDDYTVRQTQIRTWRRLKMLWENFQNTYYNDVAHDWRIPQDVNNDQTGDQLYYDKPVNIFRAYLESIIAALSVTIPGIKCYPDDAENPLDLNTAKAGDKIAKLIYRHNDVNLLWLHSLFIFCTEGMVAGYNYADSKEEYGQYTEDEYESKMENHITATCPNCGMEMDDAVTNTPEVPLETMPEEPEYCPSCGSLVVPQLDTQEVEISELIKSTSKNKTHQCIEALGGLYVKVPNWARCQKDCNYLFYSYETHYTNALHKYPHLRGEIDCGVFDPYEVWGRLSPQYRNEYPREQVTCRYAWFRPSAYNILDDDQMKVLQKHFPDGVKVELVNDVYAQACPCKLDDEWTLTYNPMSDYVHSDPIGLLLVSVQEITNDLLSLTLQTIEHGIGQTFADPRVLDFRGYRQLETAPGQIFPAKAPAGKALGEGFFEVKTATLSQEVMPFGQEVQSLGQLVSGALPSLFGGAMEEQKTASGYAMSRAQALQRLQNVWKMFTIWWKQIFSKAIPKYIEGMQEDEKEVLMNKDGGFVNSWIRLSELSGAIGKYELEANENLPQTWSQRKDTIMQLLQSPQPEIMQMLFAPENRGFIKEAIGLDDFYIPGEEYRIFYLEKISELLQSQPMPVGMDAMGQPVEGPSVEVDPDYDNPQIGFEIVRNWVLSEDAKAAKVDNQDGFRNVLLYGKQLMMIIQQQMMMQEMAQQQGSSPNGAKGDKPTEDKKEAPIMSEADVHVQQ